MKIILPLILVVLAFLSNLIAQDSSIFKAPPEEETMVGIYGNDILQTQTGDYVIAGWIKYQSVHYRDHDLWLLKADKTGSEIWQRRLGGNSTDRANAIIQARDGNLLVAGETYSFGQGTYDMWLINLDVDGNISWHRTYGGSGIERAYDLCQAQDKGFVLTGFTEAPGRGSSDVIILKTDSLGNQEWSQTYGGEGIDRGYGICNLGNRGYAIAGYTTSNTSGGLDMLILRVDKNGYKLWEINYGGKKDDQARAILFTSDGGLIVAGGTYSEGSGLEDLICLRLDLEGKVLWKKVYGGKLSDGATAVAETVDGGFILTGYTESESAGYQDVWLLKLDNNGDQLWSRTFGGPTTDEANAVKQTSDDGYIVSGLSKSTGYRETDVWVIKTDSQGRKEWDQVFK
ncbi:MAG: hypothetical protein ACE5D2_08300 [Fidelibacterota bacterium]